MSASNARAEFVRDFSAFVGQSPSSYHAAHEVVRRLEAAGFTRLHESDESITPERGVLVRDGAVIAWVQAEGIPANAPYRIVGAHTDSPGFMLKPTPAANAHCYTQALVEVYGGPLLNSWLDRELALAGRITTRDGVEHLVHTEAMLRIPQLAIHLDRDITSEGLKLDKQRHMQPVWGLAGGSNSSSKAASEDAATAILTHLAELAGVKASDVSGWNLITVDTQPPAAFGRDGDLLASPRLDNLSSVYAGLEAFIAGASAGSSKVHTNVFVAFDHEEVGSESYSGALGSLLPNTLARLTDARSGAEVGTGAAHREALASSWLVSADAGHAIHPNYPEKHDPHTQPVLGGGPLLKMNANVRYASDATGVAMWQRACDMAGVATQTFVSNNAVPCGSTIGPLSAARSGLRTLDVGVPLLSMHSARELTHVDDIPALSKALGAFWSGA